MAQEHPDHPVYGRIDGTIVMIGFGSIGKGTWPLIERHFDYDAEKFIVIEPDPANHNFLRQHRLNFVADELTPPDLPRGAGAPARARRRVLRQRLGRHRLARHPAVLPRDRACPTSTPWSSPGPATTSAPPTTRSDQLRAAPGGARREGAPARRDHRRLLLRRQSGHGLVVRQGGAADAGPRHRPGRHCASRPRRLGATDAGPRRQGRPHRRA